MKVPVATYRVQLNRHFTFQDLIRRVDYLHALNISHLYLSPVMEAMRGSEHGYDVTDFAEVSRERGGEEGLRALDRKLRELTPRMHMILDIVPNHMAASLENKYWRDVLARGVASPYRSFFDLRVDVRGKIEIPVLWDSPEALVASGDIRLELDDADIIVRCGGNAYPVTADAQNRLRQDFEASAHKSLVDYLSVLPPTGIADVLNTQYYAFVDASGASRAASYRRFFDISGLVAMRMEDPYVFEFTHRKLFALMAELPSIAGLRIDHIDGLAEPAQYLRDLSEHVPDVWIEKILARPEMTPDWPCRGTTGYDFIDRLNLLMVDAKGFERIAAAWKRRDATWTDFGDCVRRSKTEVLETLFPAEVARLAHILKGDSFLDAGRLVNGITGLTAALPVYRVYGASGGDGREWLGKALKAMPKRATREQKRLIQAVVDPQDAGERRFFSEWQRLTGPAMAKGLEDRAHYRYTPLAALNEVGCVPVPAKTSRRDFLTWAERRQEHWPMTFNAGTTHDSKRSEDVRHRLYVLADMPEAWEDFIRRASSILKPPKELREATIGFFLQAVAGTWPLEGEPDAAYIGRLKAYMQKAAREAALDSTWSWPSHAYESQLEDFVGRALRDPAFQIAVQKLMSVIAPAGAVNSLAALTLRVLAAGIPDVYQGTETWNLSLVDPDNRVPVDFDRLERDLLHYADEGPGRREHLADLVKHWRSGTIKMWLLRELLKTRRGFLRAAGNDYGIGPLSITGEKSENIVALLLSGGDRRLAVIVPRYLGSLLTKRNGISLAKIPWGDTRVMLPKAAGVVDLLSGKYLSESRRASPRELFQDLPVAVLSLN